MWEEDREGPLGGETLVWPFTAADEADEVGGACTSHLERDEVLGPALVPFMLVEAARARLRARLGAGVGREKSAR
jgi:hypothetical protein